MIVLGIIIAGICGLAVIVGLVISLVTPLEDEQLTPAQLAEAAELLGRDRIDADWQWPARD